MKYFRSCVHLGRIQATSTEMMRKCLDIVFIVLSATALQASCRAVSVSQLPHPPGTEFARAARKTSDPVLVQAAASDLVNSWGSQLSAYHEHAKREYEVTMHLQNQDSKYLYVTTSDDVAGTQQCDKHGVFSYHVRADRSSYILNKESNKYLAINSSGKLYISSDGRSDDTDLAMEPASSHAPRHYRIYRIQDMAGKKLYLSLSKPNQKVSRINADIFHLKLGSPCF